MRILIVGCGYVGLALGARWAGQGHRVVGLRRSPAAAEAMKEAGIEPWIADATDAGALARVRPDWDWVVFCAAPSEGGEAAYRAVYVEGARSLLEWLRPHPPRVFVYTSSTSVYAQADGSRVTEASATAPAAPAARVLLEAEALVLDAARNHHFPARILRVAGIYGPGRNRIAGALRGDLRPRGAPGRTMNMVHRDDVVSAIDAVIQRGRNGEVYNVSDGSPVAESEFLAWLAGQLGIPCPPEAGAGLAASADYRAATDRRVVADKLRQETGWTPRFSSFREGYAPWLAERR